MNLGKLYSDHPFMLTRQAKHRFIHSRGPHAHGYSCHRMNKHTITAPRPKRRGPNATEAAHDLHTLPQGACPSSLYRRRPIRRRSLATRPCSASAAALPELPSKRRRRHQKVQAGARSSCGFLRPRRADPSGMGRARAPSKRLPPLVAGGGGRDQHGGLARRSPAA